MVISRDVHLLAEIVLALLLVIHLLLVDVCLDELLEGVPLTVLQAAPHLIRRDRSSLAGSPWVRPVLRRQPQRPTAPFQHGCDLAVGLRGLPGAGPRLRVGQPARRLARVRLRVDPGAPFQQQSNYVQGSVVARQVDGHPTDQVPARHVGLPVKEEAGHSKVAIRHCIPQQTPSEAVRSVDGKQCMLFRLSEKQLEGFHVT
eukprot:CAMPEP_0175768486 /NCGR_PEP_ID=MMETSP0097-20121207/70455_1 /TAXON_ID=311494 /ORGANISM="Alexandrium monilatum, Strain CCMP3105" /LENGTH=200 /DNA_ID=CAMNT_0017078603 /DNA_START=14 /DNA_END=612 /DNA_ORIENTATION=+